MKVPKGPVVNLVQKSFNTLTFVEVAKVKPIPTPETPRQKQQDAQTQFTVPLIVSTEVLPEDVLPPVSEIQAVATTTQG
ncbi:hypothetical protein BH10BAC3_BH10BAC3_09860 [soil metagenome]